MYREKQISVVIPTYNRSDDLKETLKSLKKFSSKLKEIIIVDQSQNNKIKNLVVKSNMKNLKYVFSSPPAITIARNKGVKKSAKSSKIICFLDDDVSLDKNYFREILKIFNTNKRAKAAAGYISYGKRSHTSFYNLVKRFFFLGIVEKESARMTSTYGNNYPGQLDKTINAEWIPGANMVYLRSVFKDQKFDENLLGYTIAEDTDFSYRLQKRHPNSIFVTPDAKIVHRVSMVERYPTKKMAYINQVDHFYFNFKNLNSTFKEKFIFAWALFGISLLRVLQFLKTGKETDALKLRLFFSSLNYCISNLEKIRRGNLREFIL